MILVGKGNAISGTDGNYLFSALDFWTLAINLRIDGISGSLSVKYSYNFFSHCNDRPSHCLTPTLTGMQNGRLCVIFCGVLCSLGLQLKG